MMRRIFTGLVLAGWLVVGQAIDTNESLPDPALDERYRRLTAELRCLVCQNQTLADSNATLAENLRLQVREMLVAGASDEEIIAYMVERYGDFVLYRPPVKKSTLPLWLGPLVLLAVAAAVAIVAIRRHARLPSAENGDDKGVAES